MNWESIELNQLSEKIDYGLTTSALWGKNGYKFLRITDIKNDHVDWKNVPVCDCDNKKISKYRLEVGDIVFARTGNAGKSYLIQECPPDSLFASYLIRVRPNKKELDPSFLSYYFKTPQYWSAISKSSSGTTLPGVNSTKLKKLTIPLPPLDIQKKIATVLDKADQLRQKRKKAIEKLDQLIQSVFLDMFGDPVLNPYKWKSCKLNEIAEIVSGITKGRKLKVQPDLELPYMRVANVQDGYLDLSDVKTIPGTINDIDKYSLKKNDILLTEGGDPDKLGRGAIWNNEIPNCVHQNHIFRVRLTSGNITPVYFNKLCGSVYGKRYFLKSSKQTTGIASINKTQLKKFPVLLPPLELQNKFEKIILSIISKKDSFKKYKNKLDNLFNALLQQAFKGELKFNDKAFKELEKEVMN